MIVKRMNQLKENKIWKASKSSSYDDNSYDS